MKRENVIVTPIRIVKLGQFRHFQIKLPQNTKKIIGIELGLRWLTSDPYNGLKPVQSDSGSIIPNFQFNRNIVIGDVKLQSCNASNIFFHTALYLDQNSTQGSFGRFIPQVFTHQQHALEEPVNVDGDTTILQGIYRDRLKYLGLTPKYDVNIYTWVEASEVLSKNTRCAN